MTTELHSSLFAPARGASAPSTETIPGHLQEHLERQAQLGPLLPSALRRELESLGRERDPELYHEGLLNLAGRLERNHQDELALAIYQSQADDLNSVILSASDGSQTTQGSRGSFAPLRMTSVLRRAESRRDALMGRGDTGARVEVLARRFTREATHPTTLIGMAGAQAVFGLARMALLSRLAASPTASVLTRGAGARFAASTGAFLVEAPSFTAFTRLANAGMGQSQDWSFGVVGREVASSYIALGALRMSGALSSGAYRRVAGLAPGAAATPMQSVFGQAGMFGGIVLGHEAETRLGLRERVDGATTMVDSLAMLLQFNVAGRLLHAGAPSLGRMNQELHMRGDLAAAAPRIAPRSRGLTPAFGLRPAMAGAPHSSAGERAPALDSVLMMAADPQTGAGSSSSLPPTSAISTPPPSSGPRSTPPGRRAGRLGQLIKGFQNLAARYNWNATMDLSRPLGEVPLEANVPAPRTVREGMLRAEALGQNRRALAYLRWGAHQLRHAPEVQGRFLDLMQRVFEFQARQREALEPVLQGLPPLDFRRLDGFAAEYAQALENLTPGSGRHFAEARLLLERTREWTSEESFRELSDTRLREFGIEPDTIASVGRNAHAFEQSHLEKVLDHALLRELPETATLREAVERYHRELGEIRENLVEVKNQVKELRREIAATEDVAERQAYEQEIKTISMRPNTTYIKARTRLNMAMERFLGDPLRSRVFLVENARRAMLNRGLLDAGRPWLVSQVREGLPALEGEQRAKAEEFLGAAEQMDFVEARGPLRQAYYSVLRVFGFDPTPPLAVQGRYERAMLDLVQNLPTEFWRFEPMDRQARESAEHAQTAYYRESHETVQGMREGFRGIERANDAFWERYDREAVDLYVEDLRLQLDQAESQFTQVGGQYWRNLRLNLETSLTAEDAQRIRADAGRIQFVDIHGQRFQELRETASQAIENFSSPASRGNNSRDLNRSLEVALRKVSELRSFLRQVHDETGIPGGDFRAVSALMLPFVDKADTPSRQRAGESLGAGWPILWRSFVRATALFSSLERKETTAVLDRHFLNWSAGTARETGSSFVVDPYVRNLVEAEPVVAAGNHNSWLDFLQGGTPFARAAQLGDRASTRDAMRIGAKEGLGKLVGPVMERAIELLTEQVADSAPEYDGSVTNLARAMAFGDLPGQRPGPRSAAVYDELTMSVASLVNPYAFDPFPAISSILNPPQGGRSFNIADRAAALTGRPQNLLITSSLNAYRLWPKPDRPLPLRRGPTVAATQFLPASAVMDLSSNGRQAGTRANLLRTLWLNLGVMPEYQRNVASIEQTFAPFARPVDLSVETAIASRFAGIEELYPTAEGNRRLSTERRELESALLRSQSAPGRGEESSRLLQDLELIDRVLESRTGEILRRRLVEIDRRIEEDRFETPRHDEVAGVRRLQRVVRARLKLLDQIEKKRERRQELSLTERRLLERMGSAIAGRDNVSGRDRLIEQADYYFRLRDQGKHLRRNLLESQRRYYDFVRDWNERRKDPAHPEHAQLHVSEAEGYDALWQDYRLAIETTLNVYNVTPARWEGQIIPEVSFRRDGNSTLVEPLGWEAGGLFSRSALWRFLLDDTRGIVSVAKQLQQFDPSPDLYLTLHSRAWGWRMLDRTQTRIRIENSEQIREVGNTPSVAAPTHDSGAEFMNVPSVLQDYGLRAFFMADRKFFDPFPKPPAFGVIRGLLGPMDQYGHLAIDRSDRRAAMQVMGNAGRFIGETGRSVIVFPGGTRNPVRFDENGNRFEGPIFGSKPGVAMILEANPEAPILPIGLLNGGVIFPKQNGEAFLRRGVALGREYVFRFGQPLFYDRLVPDNPTPRGAPLRAATVEELNRQFGELTGRPIAEPAASKDRRRK